MSVGDASDRTHGEHGGLRGVLHRRNGEQEWRQVDNRGRAGRVGRALQGDDFEERKERQLLPGDGLNLRASGAGQTVDHVIQGRLHGVHSEQNASLL